MSERAQDIARAARDVKTTPHGVCAEFVVNPKIRGYNNRVYDHARPHAGVGMVFEAVEDVFLDTNRYSSHGYVDIST